jgi:aminocarboxymuconate-semialdehyde decarboxylase
MLFKCAPHAPAADHGHSHTIKSNRKHLTVDIHCHVHVPECDAMIDGKWTVEQMPMIHYASDLTRKLNVEQNEILMPRLTDPELRISEMDACGVDVQAISPSPFHYSYWADPELGRDVARVANNRVGEMGAQYPDRFGRRDGRAISRPFRAHVYGAPAASRNGPRRIGTLPQRARHARCRDRHQRGRPGADPRGTGEILRPR